MPFFQSRYVHLLKIGKERNRTTTTTTNEMRTSIKLKTTIKCDSKCAPAVYTIGRQREPKKKDENETTANPLKN